MRFFYKLIIGLILFNSFILIFAQFFPNTTTHNAQNISSDSAYTTHDLGSMIYSKIDIARTAAIFALFILAGGALGIFTGVNMPLYLGISIIISIITTLYITMIDVFTEIMNYPVVSQIWTLLTIIIGIYFIFSIGDILLGRSDAD